jgi:methionyl-tRNA formyltransferase
MKIAFFSSSRLALPLLEKLNSDFAVKLVVTNADRLVGRCGKLTPSPLKLWAKENNILCETPTTLKNDAGKSLAEKIKSLEIDLAIVIDYGMLIPEIVFSAPKFKTINIHFSQLPKYRGPYPDAFVVLNAEKETAVSFVLIDQGFDTGDIIAQIIEPVSGSETALQLHEKLYEITFQNISYIITSWANWNMNKNYNHNNDYNLHISLFFPPKKQDNSQASFTKLLCRDDGFIPLTTLQKITSGQKIELMDLPKLIKNNASKSLLENTKAFYFLLFAFYLSLFPWPGIWTSIKIQNINKRLKILKLHLSREKIIIDKVQLEGKKPVSWKEFSRAYKIFIPVLL